MFRLLFVMVTTVLLGLGSGYFLWGTRVARLTESLSGLTLELDTMRERLAMPRGNEPEQGSVRAADELRVINESIALVRQDLAEQKATIERTATACPESTLPVGVASATELRTVRKDLEACIADKQDLEVRCAAAAAAATAATTPPPPMAPPPPPPRFYAPR